MVHFKDLITCFRIIRPVLKVCHTFESYSMPTAERIYKCFRINYKANETMDVCNVFNWFKVVFFAKVYHISCINRILHL